MKFSPAQVTALDAIGRWLRRGDEPVFFLTGYAGTGKTTVARHAVEAFDGPVGYAAPTGKAAAVLKSRGAMPAMTIHRWLYRPKQRSSARLQELLDSLKTPGLSHAERAGLHGLIKEEQDRLSKPFFERHEDAPAKSVKLMVVDEGSMVTEEMLKDLTAVVPRVLVMGDPAQLPPVQARSPLDRRPADAHLDEVHRQALDSPVLRAATLIREGHAVSALWDIDESDAWRARAAPDTQWEDYRAADQVLVATNERRRQLNTRFRARLGHRGAVATGDRLVFLRNDYEVGVYNGTTGTVTWGASDDASHALVNVATDEGPYTGLEITFNPETRRGSGMHPVDYGYALTVHKAQGSEWPHVLVFDVDQNKPQQYRRWLYTALTRSAGRVTYVGNR